MAFALTGYVARGTDISGPNFKKGTQQVVIRATGTSADVDLDIGDAAGTFWTAAIADTTYGALATKALLSLQRVAAQSVANVAVSSNQLIDRVQVASLTTTGQFTLANDVIGPNIAFNAGDGETAYYIILDYELNDRVFPEILSLWPA